MKRNHTYVIYHGKFYDSWYLVAVFDKKKDALTKSDTTGVYEEAMIIIETEQ